MTTPTQQECMEHWRPIIEIERNLWKKVGLVHARAVEEDSMIVTIVDGEEETRKMGHIGDMLIQGADGERYTISITQFHRFYDHSHPEMGEPALHEQGFRQYHPLGLISVHIVTENDITTFFPLKRFIARWDEPMVIHIGDTLAMPFPALDEVYRIARHSFEASYSRYEPS